jgi:hypothetical protein
MLMLFALHVLACPLGEKPGHRECVAVIAETPSVAECRQLYQEIKATLPANLHLGFPECVRLRKRNETDK